MGKQYKLTVEKRETDNKLDLKSLRRNKKIPGVYYSYDSTNILFQIDESEIHNAIQSGANIFSVNVGGNDQNVIFKSVQYHPVTDKIIHIDLYGVKMDEKITVKVSINLIGDAVGVKEEGGVLNSPTSEIEIACLPMDIIGSIEIDISALSLGDSMPVGDIKLDDKHELMSSPDAVVASVTHAMREEEPAAEADDDALFMDEEDGETGEAAPSDSADSGESSGNE